MEPGCCGSISVLVLIGTVCSTILPMIRYPSQNVSGLLVVCMYGGDRVLVPPQS